MVDNLALLSGELQGAFKIAVRGSESKSLILNWTTITCLHNVASLFTGLCSMFIWQTGSMYHFIGLLIDIIAGWQRWGTYITIRCFSFCRPLVILQLVCTLRAMMAVPCSTFFSLSLVFTCAGMCCVLCVCVCVCVCVWICYGGHGPATALQLN